MMSWSMLHAARVWWVYGRVWSGVVAYVFGVWVTGAEAVPPCVVLGLARRCTLVWYLQGVWMWRTLVVNRKCGVWA